MFLLLSTRGFSIRSKQKPTLEASCLECECSLKWNYRSKMTMKRGYEKLGCCSAVSLEARQVWNLTPPLTTFLIVTFRKPQMSHL